MLALIRQPRVFCPNTKDRPLRWVIATNEHIQQVGSKAYFELTFSGSGAANGQQVEVNGITFETFDGIPYSDSTWDTGNNAYQGARNFADMLRSNYEFAGFQFWLTTDGTSWSVNAQAYETGEVTPWTFDFSALTVAHSFSDTGPGQNPITRPFRIWYRPYEQDTPLAAERYAELRYDPDGFPAYGIAEMDIQRLARGLVRSTVPRYSWNGPQLDPLYARRVHIRYGSIEPQEDCSDSIRGKVYQTAETVVTNSVFQLHETTEFLKHCPGGANPVRFLTDRPDTRTLCGTVHEWCHIWLERNRIYKGEFRVRYNWYKGDDDLADYLGTHEIPVQFNTQAAAIVDLGPGNKAVWMNAPGGTRRYTVEIMAQTLNEFNELDFVQYSNQLERRVTDCNCKAAEVYFLEDRGSWNTVVFEYLDERQITQEPVEFETRFDFDQIRGNQDHLYIEGGRYSEAATADQTFILISERVVASKRKIYEQLLRSPETYIKTVNGNGEERIRRVIFDREAKRIIKRGEGTRIALTFRFATTLRTHR